MGRTAGASGVHQACTRPSRPWSRTSTKAMGDSASPSAPPSQEGSRSATSRLAMDHSVLSAQHSGWLVRPLLSRGHTSLHTKSKREG